MGNDGTVHAIFKLPENDWQHHKGCISDTNGGGRMACVVLDAGVHVAFGAKALKVGHNDLE